VDQQSTRYSVSGRHSSEDESFLHMLGVTLPDREACGLLSSEVE
jgi:hypothetical protein